jgi:alkylhydroperoxidase family enzyme
MPGGRHFAVLLAALALAGCGTSAAWVKMGADDAAVSRDTRDCRAQAEIALSTDRSVDQDILASRGRNWQQAGTLEPRQQQMREQAGGHAEAVFDGCMQAKGYRRQPKPG